MNRRMFVFGGMAVAVWPFRAGAHKPQFAGTTVERGDSYFFNHRDAHWTATPITCIPATPDEEIAFFNAGDPLRHLTIVNDLDEAGNVLRWRIEYDDGEVREWQSPTLGAGVWAGEL